MSDPLDEIELALEAIHNRWPTANLIMMASANGKRMTCRYYGQDGHVLASMLRQGLEAMDGVLDQSEQLDKDKH